MTDEEIEELLKKIEIEVFIALLKDFQPSPDFRLTRWDLDVKELLQKEQLKKL